ncbi:MAG TPA: DegT/DnrJ/EryC1/StrS aminotransferase family protein [Fimbriimonadaceae bacterium]|nr:DegT/DnrJ/EryC1/StrS aminotransferase family protein [Fimbriimonadaceae bacterium]
MQPLAASVLPTLTAPWPHFEADEVEAVNRVLASGKVNYWTGSEGKQFESEFASYVGTKHAIALANGTVALELIWRALGLEPGDEVVTTPRTFIASAASAVLSGLSVRFADVDRESGNITPETVARAMTPRTKALLAVHLGGWPCDMEGLLSLGPTVIEDCAQAHGARVNGQSVGSFGVASAWSFCQDKIMTTLGEGGMVTTDNDELWADGWSMKDHGKSFDAVFNRDHAPGFRWLHESFGTNWRMTEVQSAQGRVALRKLDKWVNLRRNNARQLIKALEDFSSVRVPVPASGYDHAYYRLYAYVRPEALKSDWSRDRIMGEIAGRGVPCFSGSCSEIYLEKAFDGHPQHNDRLPVAKELGDTSLCFLVHPTLTSSVVDRCCDVITDVIGEAQR